MASITQSIGAYTGGISQQPDELKVPGQVKDAVNVLPDVTHGMLKRPGGQLVKSLSDGSNNSYTTGKWFHYYRDENEQYIGQIIRRSGHADDGKIRMWKCSDGAECTVNYGTAGEATLTSYLEHTNDEDIQTLTLNDYTYITNRTKRTEMLTATDDKADAKPFEAFVELKKVSYASQYSLNLYDNTDTTTVYTATRIDVERIVDSANGCKDSDGGWPADGTIPGSSGNQTRCDTTAGDQQDGYCPNVATEIFAISHGSAIDQSDINETSGQTISVVPSAGTAGDRKNLYFRIVTTGQAVAQSNDSSPDYHCRYTTTHDLLYGGEGWRINDYFYCWMKDAKYKVTIKDASIAQVQANLGLVRPLPTPFDTETTITAESVLGDIRTGINSAAFGSTAGASVQQIGNGLYITRTSAAFNVNTPVNTLLNVFTTKVDDVAELPSQCKHGYVVRVANSVADEDDYYVKFFGNNDRDGEGVWEECPEPGRMISFNPSTMPIQLVRTAANTFTVNEIAWDPCPVGDETTVPKPSFMSGYGTPNTTELDPTEATYDDIDTSRLRYINKLLFFRNRMILLSDENVIMSRPGDFYNFWPKSAVTYTATDNVDISCSSEYPAVVYDGIQVNTGLVLFTKNQQFMLTTDSDVLSPNTAKINALSTYNFNYKTSPVSLGTTVGFLDNAGKNTRFFEMTSVLREGQPDMVEQTKIVSKLFPKDLTLIANSRENSVIFFGTQGTDEIFGYRYFQSVEKRIQNAWFRWKISGTVQHIAMLDDALYVVARNGTKDVMLRYAIKRDDSENFLIDDIGNTDATDDIYYRVHLDNATTVAHTDLTYVPAAAGAPDYTKFTLPTGMNNTSAQLAAVWIPTGTDNTFQGMTASVYTFNDGGTTRVKLPGNWKTYDPQETRDSDLTDDVTPAGKVVIGYLFDMDIKLPTVYYKTQTGESFRAQMQGSLVLHRIKLSFGPLGVYETKLERVGKPDYTQLYEAIMADAYMSNRVQLTENSYSVVPIYEKNTNVTISIKSTHPSPATLYSMSWEGDYTGKYYKRV